MNQYIKDERVISATEKAFETIYKEQGYKPYKETKKKKEEADK